MARSWKLTAEDLDPRFVESLADENIIQELVISNKQSTFEVEMFCTECKELFTKVMKHIMDKEGNLFYEEDILCPRCSRSKFQINYNKENKDVVSKRINSVKLYYQNNPEVRKDISDRVKLDHINDPSRSEKLTKFVKDNPECFMYNGISKFELEVKDYIQSLITDKIIKDRNILEGKEIDIYIPSKNLGVECNGMYWHSTYKLDKTYHKDKYILAEEKGIHLIQISDNDWYNNTIKVKSYLRNLLTDKIKLYGRNTVVDSISPEQAREFYETYHLQGSNRNYSINYGLYHQGDLISCMSFGKSRIRNKSNPEGSYELHRYCVKFDCTILGGGSKLFSKFLQDYHPSEITSFSDNDYFTGNIYKLLGFKDSYVVRVYYWWNHKEILEREKCQLSILKDKFPVSYKDAIELKGSGIITNREEYIMETEGYMSYYTSGRTKWIWTKEGT